MQLREQEAWQKPLRSVESLNFDIDDSFDDPYKNLAMYAVCVVGSKLLQRSRETKALATLRDQSYSELKRLSNLTLSSVEHNRVDVDMILL